MLIRLPCGGNSRSAPSVQRSAWMASITPVSWFNRSRALSCIALILDSNSPHREAPPPGDLAGVLVHEPAIVRAGRVAPTGREPRGFGRGHRRARVRQLLARGNRRPISAFVNMLRALQLGIGGTRLPTRRLHHAVCDFALCDQILHLRPVWRSAREARAARCWGCRPAQTAAGRSSSWCSCPSSLDSTEMLFGGEVFGRLALGGVPDWILQVEARERPHAVAYGVHSGG